MGWKAHWWRNDQTRLVRCMYWNPQCSCLDWTCFLLLDRLKKRNIRRFWMTPSPIRRAQPMRRIRTGWIHHGKVSSPEKVLSLTRKRVFRKRNWTPSVPKPTNYRKALVFIVAWNVFSTIALNCSKNVQSTGPWENQWPSAVSYSMVITFDWVGKMWNVAPSLIATMFCMIRRKILSFMCQWIIFIPHKAITRSATVHCPNSPRWDSNWDIQRPIQTPWSSGRRSLVRESVEGSDEGQGISLRWLRQQCAMYHRSVYFEWTSEMGSSERHCPSPTSRLRRTRPRTLIGTLRTISSGNSTRLFAEHWRYGWGILCRCLLKTKITSQWSKRKNIFITMIWPCINWTIATGSSLIWRHRRITSTFFVVN